MIYNRDCRIIFRKIKICPFNIHTTQLFIKNFSSKYKKLVFRQKMYMISVWKTLNYKIYKMIHSYTQSSKKNQNLCFDKRNNNFTSRTGHNP